MIPGPDFYYVIRRSYKGYDECRITRKGLTKEQATYVVNWWKERDNTNNYWIIDEREEPYYE